jgi:small multidrug resistance pump
MSVGWSMTASWLFLVVAISLEVAGTTCMKMSQGFSKLIPSILVFCFYGCSLAALTMALNKIDVSIAYAVWSGLGTAAIALIGCCVFGENINLLKWVGLVFVITGVVALNLAGTGR